MNAVKTLEEVAIMTEGGKLLGDILSDLVKQVKPGVTPISIDNRAKELIEEVGGSPSFMTVHGYQWATCISVNDGVVHGIPGKEPFKVGDLVSVDVGLLYKGYHTDTSWSLYLAPDEPNLEVVGFLETGERALQNALAVAKAGNHIGHISQAMQQTIEAQGFNIVNGLVGHAIGKHLHESPQVPGKLTRAINSTPKLEENMTLAIEVIYSMGGADIVHGNDDGWTLVTEDGSLAGLFEQTIVITRNEPIVLTSKPK